MNVPPSYQGLTKDQIWSQILLRTKNRNNSFTSEEVAIHLLLFGADYYETFIIARKGKKVLHFDTIVDLCVHFKGSVRTVRKRLEETPSLYRGYLLERVSYEQYVGLS